MIILKNTLKFVTDPKNTRMLLFAGIVILILLFLHQCNRVKHFKNQIEIEKLEARRISNNYEAAMDTIKQGKLNDSTWRAEKLGYEITIDELNGEYKSLLGNFEIEKNKPPKVVIQTEYEIKENIKEVPIFIEIDGFGNKYITFNDSIRHNSNNYRYLSGKIPYKIILNPIDSTYNLIPDYGVFDLTLGMNLNLGLFQDKKTKKITILADTDYPGVNFTRIEGASIMDDPANKKIIRNMRKSWGLGLSVGYGFMINPGTGGMSTGPYFGLGLNYTPKILQWGR